MCGMAADGKATKSKYGCMRERHSCHTGRESKRVKEREGDMHTGGHTLVLFLLLLLHQHHHLPWHP